MALAERIRQIKTGLLSAVFVGMICLPTLDWVFHLDSAAAPIEKRLPAKFPEFQGLGESRDFVSGLEGYFNDHFGFRKRLIQTNHAWKRKLFGESDAEVITGRDGWLYYVGNKGLEHYFGQARFDEQDLEAWQALLETRRDWLAKRGIKYLFTVPPDKQSIYPEYLPEWCVKSEQPGKLDQFIGYMRQHSTVEVLDLRKPLLEAKGKGVIYLKTDTHWNYVGGFVAYQAVVEALGRQMPGLKPLRRDAFDWEPVKGAGGDLAVMIDDPSLQETEQFGFTVRPPLKPLKVYQDAGRLPKAWTQGQDPTVSESERGEGKAVMFHDSFAGCWRPFLGYQFKEVVYIWQNNWDAAFLEREKPDVVIDEIVERFFNTQNPRMLMKKDDLK